MSATTQEIIAELLKQALAGQLKSVTWIFAICIALLVIVLIVVLFLFFKLFLCYSSVTFISVGRKFFNNV